MSIKKLILQEARALINNGWTQGCYSRDAYGSGTLPYTEAAVCWCAAGAVWKAESALNTILTQPSYFAEIMELLKEQAGESIAVFNDTPGRTKEEVLAVFDKVINEIN